MTKVYAVYQGDDFQCMGTIVECSKYLKVTPNSLRRIRKNGQDAPYDYSYFFVDVTNVLENDPYVNLNANVECESNKFF